MITVYSNTAASPEALAVEAERLFQAVADALLAQAIMDQPTITEQALADMVELGLQSAAQDWRPKHQIGRAA